MDVITANLFGYGQYVDRTTHNRMDLFVENASGISRMINKIDQLFMTLFDIKPSTIRFTKDRLVFQVEKKVLLDFIEAEIRSNKAQGLISRETIATFLPKSSSETQDFETFLGKVKLGVLALAGTKAVGDVVSGIFKGIGNVLSGVARDLETA